MAGAAVGPLAGARAPPVRERAAVEQPGSGALSPRARARAPGVPNGERLLAVVRPLGEGGAHPSRTSAAMGDA